MDVVTEKDLQWWLDLAPTLDWTWAKTYADSAPHYWVSLSRGHLTREEFIRAGAVIRTFGTPGKFYYSTQIYLKHEGRRYWTMDLDVGITDLINMADDGREYGVQNAQSTETGLFTKWDKIAWKWEEIRSTDQDEKFDRFVARTFKHEPPRVLDIGCATGACLKSKYLSQRMYTGVDSSKGMLNELLMRWPDARVVPGVFDAANFAGSEFDLVVISKATGVTEDDLTGISYEYVVVRD